MEEVLGEGVVGHELSDEQALDPVAAVADEVCQSPVPPLPDPCLLLQIEQIASKAIAHSRQRDSGGWSGTYMP